MRGLRYEEEADQADFASMDEDEDAIVHPELQEVQEAGEEQPPEEEEEADEDQEPKDDQEQATSVEEGEVQNFNENDFPEAEFDRSFTQEVDHAHQSVPSSGARRRRDSDINNDRIPKRSRHPDKSSPAITRSKSRDN